MAGLVVANGIINFLNLYNTLLIVRLVLTWFPNSPSAIVTPLRCAFQKYCEFLLVFETFLGAKSFPLRWWFFVPSADADSVIFGGSTICDPYLNIFRGLIPPLGGTLDLSPILAFLVLNAFTSTASALPAELPVTEANQENPSSRPARFSHLTTSQKKWMRRLQGNRTKSSSSAKLV